MYFTNFKLIEKKQFDNTNIVSHLGVHVEYTPSLNKVRIIRTNRKNEVIGYTNLFALGNNSTIIIGKDIDSHHVGWKIIHNATSELTLTAVDTTDPKNPKISKKNMVPTTSIRRRE